MTDGAQDPNEYNGHIGRGGGDGFPRGGGGGLLNLLPLLLGLFRKPDGPFILVVLVGTYFSPGPKVGLPEPSNYSQMGCVGHAMAVIGYNHKLAGGAFQIMNSWGPEWGENVVPYWIVEINKQ
jgi:hypothetical protein